MKNNTRLMIFIGLGGTLSTIQFFYVFSWLSSIYAQICAIMLGIGLIKWIRERKNNSDPTEPDGSWAKGWKERSGL